MVRTFGRRKADERKVGVFSWFGEGDVSLSTIRSVGNCVLFSRFLGSLLDCPIDQS